MTRDIVSHDKLLYFLDVYSSSTNQNESTCHKTHPNFISQSKTRKNGKFVVVLIARMLIRIIFCFTNEVCYIYQIIYEWYCKVEILRLLTSKSLKNK